MNQQRIGERRVGQPHWPGRTGRIWQLREAVYRRELRSVITTSAEIMDELYPGS